MDYARPARGGSEPVHARSNRGGLNQPLLRTDEAALDLIPGRTDNRLLFHPVVEVVRNHAATAVTVGLGSQHAFFLYLAGGGERMALRLEDTVVRDLFGIF